MISVKEINILEKLLNYKFKNKELLKKSFMHSSLIKKNFKDKNKFISDYERLEFLGDRVLGLIISHLIYNKFPNYSEGKMSVKLSYLVQKSFLFSIASELKLYKFIRTSKDKNINLKKNKSILSDTLEAIIAAIFIDGGFRASKRFIQNIWKDYIYNEELKIDDPKTILQELSQKKHKKLPKYDLVKKEGPPHRPSFYVSVSSLNISNITAKGSSKREAEKLAAKKLLKLYNSKYAK